MSGTINFNGADADPLPSPYASASGWGNLRRVSNECGNSAGSNADAAMRRTDSSATRSIVEYRSGTFDGGPAFLDSSGNGYITTSYSGVHVEFYEVTGGPNYNKVGGNHSVTFAQGDTAELELDGDDLVFYKNGSEVGRETDTTFRTGLTPAIFAFDGGLRVDNHSDGASGSQNIDVGLASETDTAFSVGKRKTVAVGLASETDTALSSSMMHSINVGLVTETDTAFSVGKRKSKTLGLVTETDSALGVTISGDFPTSYFTDFPDTESPIDQDGMFRVGTETAFYGAPRSTPGKCFATTFVGEISADFDDCLAHLINHAIPADHRITATVFRAEGYDPEDTHEVGLYAHMVIGEEFVRGYEFLFSSGGAFQIVIWLGTDHDLDNFDTSLTLTGPGPGTLADGDEIAVQVTLDGGDVNFELFKNGESVGTATDDTWTDGNPGMGFFVRPGDTTKENFCLTSWSVTGAGIFESVGLATETDTAFSVGKRKTHAVGLVSEADSAFGVSAHKTRTAGLVTETDSALVVRPQRMTAVGLASETDTAFSVARRKSRAVGLALEFDGAFGVEGGEQVGGAAGGSRRLGFGLGLG